MPTITVSPNPMTVGEPSQVSVSDLDPDQYVNVGTGEWQDKAHGKDEFVAGWVFGLGFPDADGNFGPIEHAESATGTVTFYVKQKGNGPWSQKPDATLNVECV